MSGIKKTVLITGANRGIGYALSKIFAEHGYWVFMAGRNATALKNASDKLGSVNLQTLLLDVRDPVSVKEAEEKLAGLTAQLDVLINNAAILPSPANTVEVSEDELVTTLQTNVLGPWRLSKTLRPLLKKSKDPRIINISSEMGALEDMGNSYFAYRLSKTALNGLTAISAADFENKIKVVSVCPGWVKTDMGGSAAQRTPEAAAEHIFWLAETQNLESGKFYRDRKIINW